MPTSLNNVLVADDVLDLAEVLAQVLELSVAHPIEVRIAHNGGEAVLLAKQNRPAIAFLDMDMPVMTGAEAAECIRRAYPDEPRPVLVAMTGNATWKDRGAATKVFDYVFYKPLDLQRLVQLVDETL